MGTHAADESVSQLLMEAADIDRLRGAAPASPAGTPSAAGACSGTAGKPCGRASIAVLRMSG